MNLMCYLYPAVTSSSRAESELVKLLMSNYDVAVRPVADHKDTLHVQFDIALYKLIQLVGLSLFDITYMPMYNNILVYITYTSSEFVINRYHINVLNIVKNSINMLPCYNIEDHKHTSLTRSTYVFV